MTSCSAWVWHSSFVSPTSRIRYRGSSSTRLSLMRRPRCSYFGISHENLFWASIKISVDEKSSRGVEGVRRLVELVHTWVERSGSCFSSSRCAPLERKVNYVECVYVGTLE